MRLFLLSLLQLLLFLIVLAFQLLELLLLFLLRLLLSLFVRALLCKLLLLLNLLLFNFLPFQILLRPQLLQLLLLFLFDLRINLGLRRRGPVVKGTVVGRAIGICVALIRIALVYICLARVDRIRIVCVRICRAIRIRLHRRLVWLICRRWPAIVLLILLSLSRRLIALRRTIVCPLSLWRECGLLRRCSDSHVRADGFRLRLANLGRRQRSAAICLDRL